MLLMACLLGCGRADAPRFAPEEEDAAAAGAHSIAWLKSRCRGESLRLTEEVTVTGRIVANDRFGEWSRAVVIEDESGGITIRCDASDLAARYPFGARVTLYANGLVLNNYGGRIEVGAEPDRCGNRGIPADWLAARLRLHTVQPERAPEPRLLTIEGLTLRDVDTYVRIEGVHFLEEAAWCDRDPETGRRTDTDRTIADRAGRTLRVRTSGSAEYAGEPLPEGYGSLCGIVDCFAGTYALRVVNRTVDFSPSQAAEW